MAPETVQDDPEYALTPEGFHSTYLNLLRSERKTWPARSWTPSNLGHPCDRFLVWRFTRWDEQQAIEPELQAIFQEGNIHQPHVYAALERMGFQIQREDEKTKQWEPSKGIRLSGRIDGKILGFKGQKYQPSIILEIKTTSPYTFDALNTIDDVRKNRAHYVRAYYDQDILYCILEERPRGIMVFKNKQTGLLKAIPFELDYDRAEWLIKRAERLQPMVDKKLDPPPIDFDAKICGDCAFNHLCFPDKQGGQGAALVENAELLMQLEERAELEPMSKRYDALDKAAKDTIKAVMGKDGQAMCGPWAIKVATRPRKSYTVEDGETTTVKLSRIE
jgi:CRISPR/Cas system-associated exonuclease Cas4 (RecB family)